MERKIVKKRKIDINELIMQLKTAYGKDDWLHIRLIIEELEQLKT